MRLWVNIQTRNGANRFLRRLPKPGMDGDSWNPSSNVQVGACLAKANLDSENLV